MSSGFNTRIERDKSESYTVIFYTDDESKYREIEDACRKMIGHGKENAEKRKPDCPIKGELPEQHKEQDKMTKEEIIEVLRHCAAGKRCPDCPARNNLVNGCFLRVMEYAADALEAAEKRIATYQSDVADLEQREKELNDVLNERARLITELQSRIAELEAEMKRKDKEFEKMASDAAEYEADLRERIEELVTKCRQLEAQLAKEGEWIPEGKNLAYCSNCKNCVLRERTGAMFYCPNCGARMKVE